MRRDYVELDRTFLDYSDELDIEGSAWKSYFAGLSGNLNWEKLLQSRYVVILGEAGSGKTWELEAQTEKIKKIGQIAFFIRIEALANQILSAALDASDLAPFSKWQNGIDSATFFLDSVDEAKLQKPQAFYDALNALVKGIGPAAIKRMRVVVSCRVSEWRGKADLCELQRRFDIPEVQLMSTGPPMRQEGPQPLLRLVQLAPLDRERVAILAAHLNVRNTSEFIAAIDAGDLWDFAGRPQDVENLATYWHEKGRFGSIRQMVDFDISHKLRESRDRVDPLSLDEAINGAVALAAAVLLCRRFTFAVPDEPSDPSLAASIDPQDVLTGWKADHIRALLSRAIFDEATYGRVRFHHRTIAEYLAAKWIISLQKGGCSLRSIENIIIGQAHGKEVILPSSCAVAAWLTVLDWPWRRLILDRIIQLDPAILLNSGDPQSLPVDAKRLILKSIVDRNAGRHRVRIDADIAQLRRLAHDDLAGEINKYLVDREISIDIRELFLRLIGHGKLSACIDTAIAIIADESEDEILRYYALFAVSENGTTDHLRTVVDVVKRSRELSSGMCALLCERLYPRIIGAEEVLHLISRAMRSNQMQVRNLRDAVNKLITDLAPEEHLTVILRGLIALVTQPPLLTYEGTVTPISSRFMWLGNALYEAVRRLLLLHCLDEQAIADLGQAIFLLGKIKKYDRDIRENRYNLQDESEAHPNVRRTYVWNRVADLRSLRADSEINAHSIYDFYSVLSVSAVDQSWLLEDISERNDEQDREIALKIAATLWYEIGRTKTFRHALKNAVRGNSRLRDIFQQQFPNPLFRVTDLIKSCIYRLQHRERVRIRRKINDIVGHLTNVWRNYYNRYWCLAHIDGIRSARYPWTLYKLADYQERGRSVPGESHSDLVADFGSRVATAAREGWKVSWRQFRPLFPHEREDQSTTDIRITIGLKGIEADVADGLQIETLTTEEATIATLYALYEWNGFPSWCASLAKSHPAQVQAVLIRCVEMEWLTPAGAPHPAGILSSLLYSGKIFRQLIVSRVVELLKLGDPPHIDVLRYALTIIPKEDPVAAGIAELAAQRICCYQSDDRRFFMWLVFWLNLDCRGAIDFLDAFLTAHPDSCVSTMESLGSILHNQKVNYENNDAPYYCDLSCLSRLIRVFYLYIRPMEDIDRSDEGSFSPTARDDAQWYRSYLLEMLVKSPDKAAHSVLRSLSDETTLVAHRDYILRLLDERTEIDAEGPAWMPADIYAYARDYEILPRSAHILFSLVLYRLDDIKNLIEYEDFSIRGLFRPDDPEDRLQKWFAAELTRTSNQKYNIVREAEVDQEKKPDILVVAPGIERLPIEIKWAHKWSFSALSDALIEQLIGQYMRTNRSRHGIYLLCNAEVGRQWEPSSGQRIDFGELVARLMGQANEVLHNDSDIDSLAVIGIDFTTSA